MNDEEDEEQSNAGVSTPEPVHLGPPQDPHVGGEMTLFEAVYWIASEGGAASFDTDDASIWRRAAEALHARIVDGSVLLMGRRHGLGFAERIDGVLLSGVEMNPPYAVNAPHSLIMGRRPYIDYVGRDSREQWQDWAHDDLHGANRVPEYTHLQVKAPDVARIWPFPARLAAPLAARECDNTSSQPGRPTDEQVRAIIDQENARRSISNIPRKVTQNEAAELVRAHGFVADRDQVRPIARTLKGNNKRGPQGPRK